jgi:tetratricopeptide (TPR) repeat protein
MPDNTATFGALLSGRRQSAGLSQEELAERSGLGIRSIRNLERGRTRWPHPDSVRRLADALKLRGQARDRFFAAAGRRLVGEARAPGPVVPGPSPAVGTPLMPRQLPGPVRDFVGRETELAELDRLLDRVSWKAPGAVVISAMGGTAGVGKTALAVQWAHQVAADFPDGQLYVNLRGYDPRQPVPAADALAEFLRALGVPNEDIPAETAERSAWFRSLLARRRMLIVLDNASEVEQVRPLLAGSSGCVTLVTSRDALVGLVARDGAVRLDLDLLPPPDAMTLLRTLIGTRVDADPDAAGALAASCARLPLALRVAAELAAARPAASLAELAGELADRQRRLELLDVAGDPHTGIRGVLSWSYQHLDDEAARLFRRLGLHPGPDLDLYAAAALVGTDPGSVRRMFDALVSAHLIQPAVAGRYAMHDLLSAYAHELAGEEEGDGERQAALARLSAYYLHAAAAAMDILFPAERHRRPRIPPPPTGTPPLASAVQARQWLDGERANLAAIASCAAAHGQPGQAIQLSAIVARYLAGGGHFPEAFAVHGCAREAAAALGDRAAEAAALSNLSQLDLHHGHIRQATDRLREALALFREAGDRAGEARALHNLATVEAQEGAYQQATDHHQQALELYLALGNRTGAARALHGLSNVDLRTGHYERAGDSLRRALMLCQETGDRVNEAYVLANLGDLDLRLGDHANAESRLARALVLFREAGDRTGEAYALTNLGIVQLRQGYGPLAIDYHEQAQAVAQENRDRFGEAEALNGLGEACLALGQVSQAQAAHIRALDLASLTGDKFEQARAHVSLARAHHAAAEPDEAFGHWQRALALYGDLGTPEAEQIRDRLAAGDYHREP